MHLQRVVLVDDEAPILSALQRLLRNESVEVLATEDPQEAFEWVRTRDVGVLVSDDRMPQLSGTSLCQLAKAHSPATARILLTSYAGEEIVLRMRKDGLFHLFAKPWDDDELRRAIREGLRKRELEGLGRDRPSD